MKRVIIVLAVVAMFALAGCNGNGNNTQGNWKTFIGGTNGVSMHFEVDAPPTEVNVNDPFIALVVLENMGEHTVEAGDYQVTLKGFSPTDFGTSADDLVVMPQEPLQANDLNPDTGEPLESYPVYVQIPESGDLSYDDDGSIAGNTNFPFVAEVCYKYLTTANAKLCVKNDLTKTSDTEVCTISGPQTITTSGGPIQISDFKEFSGGPDGIRFSFKIIAANTGGTIYERDTMCNSDDSSSDYVVKDRIYVSVRSGIGELSCSGFLSSGGTAGTTGGTEGYVKLSGGSRQITCSQPIGDDVRGDYVKIVSITAEYDYEQSISKQVLVKQIT